MKRKYRGNLISRLIAKGMLHANTVEGGGGGGGNEPTVAELQAALATSQASIKALETKNAEVIGTNKKLTDSLKNFDGLDPEKMRNIMTQFENNEELKLISEGKHDEVIRRRTEKVEAQYKTTVEKLNTDLTQSREKLTSSEKLIRNLVIDNSVTSEFIKEGGLQSAIDDVKLRAGQTFSVEDGVAVIRDKEGKLVTGKDGAMTVAEWVGKLKEDAPHLFPGSTGANANGNNSAGGLTGIDAKIKAAAAAGDTTEYRRLREIKKQQSKKKE